MAGRQAGRQAGGQAGKYALSSLSRPLAGPVTAPVTVTATSTSNPGHSLAAGAHVQDFEVAQLLALGDVLIVCQVDLHRGAWRVATGCGELGGVW